MALPWWQHYKYRRGYYYYYYYYYYYIVSLPNTVCVAALPCKTLWKLAGSRLSIAKISRLNFLASSSWRRTPSRALPYWRLDVKYPCPLPSSKPCGPPKFWGRTSSSITLSQVDLGRPGGLRQFFVAPCRTSRLTNSSDVRYIGDSVSLWGSLTAHWEPYTHTYTHSLQ